MSIAFLIFNQGSLQYSKLHGSKAFSFKIKNSKLKIILKPDAVIGQKGRFCKGLRIS